MARGLATQAGLSLMHRTPELGCKAAPWEALPNCAAELLKLVTWRLLGSSSASSRAQHCWPVYCHCAGLKLALPRAEVPALPPLLPSSLVSMTTCWAAAIASVQHVGQQLDT
jgi:hypothetical protein